MLRVICWWYAIDEAFKKTDKLLELARLKRADCLLMSFMSMLEGILVIVEFEIVAEV